MLLCFWVSCSFCRLQAAKLHSAALNFFISWNRIRRVFCMEIGCIDSWSPVSVCSPLHAQCFFPQGVTHNHTCWLKMRIIMWNSCTGENMKYCIEDYEIKQCLIIKGISFAFLPLDRAPYGSFLASEMTSLYLDSFKQGLCFPLCFCPCLLPLFPGFSLQNTFLFLFYIQVRSLPVRETYKERMNEEQSWQPFLLKLRYFFRVTYF